MTTKTDITLPPLPRYMDSVTAEEFNRRVLAWGRAAVEADRQGRGEPVAWPKTAAEIRDFIDVNYISMAGDDDPSDDDKYTLTAHDLLSAFRWWTGFAPHTAEPVKSKRRYAEGTALDEYGVIPMCDQVDDEPVKVPSDEDLLQLASEYCDSTDATGEEPRFTTDESILHFARALLSRYSSGQPAASAIPVPTTKAEYIALLDMAIELGKKLNIAWEDAFRATKGQPAASAEPVNVRNAHAIADLVNSADQATGPIEALHEAIDRLAAPVAQESQQVDDAAVSAIQFALQADEGLAWLRCWNEGDFDACRKWWPDAPEECFIGADPLHPGTKAALSAAPVAQEPVTDTYVQTVPDKCDRIVWRGSYYHLPLRAVAQDPVAWLYEVDVGGGEWEPYLHLFEPLKCSNVRNVQPLYASPVAAQAQSSGNPGELAESSGNSGELASAQDLEDAERYREFFAAGLPITFLGADYRDKPSLDAAIDAARAAKGGV